MYSEYHNKFQSTAQDIIKVKMVASKPQLKWIICAAVVVCVVGAAVGLGVNFGTRPNGKLQFCPYYGYYKLP